MLNYQRFQFLPSTAKQTIALHLVKPADYPAWLKNQPATTQNWLTSQNFNAHHAHAAKLSGAKGEWAGVVAGYEREDLASLAQLVAMLPIGKYHLETSLKDDFINKLALAWGLHFYRFNQYKKSGDEIPQPQLKLPKGFQADATKSQIDATYLVRDLVNIPANDLGPQELADISRTLAKSWGMTCRLISGNNLLTQSYPAIYAVGQASTSPPCLIDLHWGNPKAPKVTLCGKGVTFDTGGLDIKPSSGMRIMKKDMGGAAHVLGLAKLIIDAQLPIRLRVLIPAVENSIAGNAFRPGDIINTRKGLTVEIGNTDAEGRVVLADALCEADSENPEIIIDYATLTGAARTALGPDLPAIFVTHGEDVRSLIETGLAICDPVWPLPLWQGYRDDLKSPVADLNNTGRDAFAGAIYAALFMQHFVSPHRRWVHIDTYAWNATRRPGRPDGGEALGLRTVFSWLQQIYGNTKTVKSSKAKGYLPKV